ncbi:MAG: Lar family restriction alleviation protein [Desulfuromonadales bacterium]|nr:Lar family restriction alleviation protein [Desulfuromonadales bacterium]
MELEPCPFCGALEQEWDGEKHKDGTEYWWVKCSFCGARGPLGASQENAAWAWNGAKEAH